MVSHAKVTTWLVAITDNSLQQHSKPLQTTAKQKTIGTVGPHPTPISQTCFPLISNHQIILFLTGIIASSPSQIIHACHCSLPDNFLTMLSILRQSGLTLFSHPN
jgi:hypothetical protein